MINKIITIAKEAGEIVREGFRKNMKIEFKTDESNLVTEYDKKSEKHIIEFINKEFPGHSVLAEESGINKGSKDYIWVIDPIDGTTNFAHGLPIFSISIAVQRNEETIAGVIYDVMNDFIYAAEYKGGAYKNEKKILVSTNEKLSRSVLVTGFPYDIKQNPLNAIEKFNRLLLESRAIRRLGSAAIDFCYVADGVFDGFWEIHLQPWDVAAGILLVREAGGKVTNFAGNEINIFSEEILATNGNVHEKMVELLRT